MTSSPVMLVEFRGDRGVQGEFAAFCSQWIRLVVVPHRVILERIMNRARNMD